MQIDKLIITIFGALGIVLTYWYFFGKKEESVEVKKNEIDIIVDGGYQPSSILVSPNTSITLNFIRRDSNPCLEEVVLSDFKIKKYLPLGEKVSVVIKPTKAATFPFSCGMGMFHGKIIVK